MQIRFLSAVARAFALLLIAPTAAPVAAAPMKLSPAARAAVKIENFSFSPAKLTVRAGATVTWTNGDDIPHNIVARNGAFRSKVLDTGDSFSFTFSKAGTYIYFCGLHPHMVGQIIVT